MGSPEERINELLNKAASNLEYNALDEAVECAKEALKIDPYHQKALLGLAGLLKMKALTAGGTEAMEFYKKAIACFERVFSEGTGPFNQFAEFVNLNESVVEKMNEWGWINKKELKIRKEKLEKIRKPLSDFEIYGFTPSKKDIKQMIKKLKKIRVYGS